MEKNLKTSTEYQHWLAVSLVNVVPTKENVDYDHKYHYTKDSGVDLGFGGIRDLKRGHINDIKNDIKNGKAKYISPIEVNINTNEIIDGCHRFKAVKELWEEGIDCELTVLFYDIPIEEQRDTVVIKNITPKNWNKADFVKMYTQEGNPSVERLVEFCKTHDMCHGPFNKKGECKTIDRYGMAFLKGVNVTNELLKTLNQTVEITEDDVEFANMIHPEVMKIYEMCGYTTTAGWFESLIQAWYQYRSDSRDIRKLEKIGGIEEYFRRLEHLILEGNFNREQVQSRAVWYSRFQQVADCDKVKVPSKNAA